MTGLDRLKLYDYLGLPIDKLSIPQIQDFNLLLEKQCKELEEELKKRIKQQAEDEG